VIAYLILFYSFIQLWEAFLWRAINNKNEHDNIKFTKIICMNLSIQTFGIGLGIYIQTKDPFVLAIGLGLFLYDLFNLPQFKPSTIANNGHIKWVSMIVSIWFMS
jgi:hypothetical protein